MKGAGYRPMPADFPATFARVGWEGIEAETRAHKSTIKRWIIAYGEVDLQKLRRAWLEAHYAKNLNGRRIPGQRPGRHYPIGHLTSAVNRGRKDD